MLAFARQKRHSWRLNNTSPPPLMDAGLQLANYGDGGGGGGGGMMRGCCSSGSPGNLREMHTISSVPAYKHQHPTIPATLLPPSSVSSVAQRGWKGSFSLGTYLEVGPRRLMIMRLIVSNPINRWQRAALLPPPPPPPLLLLPAAAAAAEADR